MEYQISYACISHIGKRRRMNQDNFLCCGVYVSPEQPSPLHLPLTGTISSAQTTLFGVFDGMGGEERGEMASYLAARAASRTPLSEEPVVVLNAVCQNANRDICEFVSQNGLGTCGTTAAMLLLEPEHLTACNIGDSKIFHLTEQHLVQISEDHLSLAPAGVKAPLSQCLGIPPEELTLCPHYDTLDYGVGDKYLLCSDGLTDMVPLAEIEHILSVLPPEEAAQVLLQRALDYGGKDNITLLILQVEKPERKFLHYLKKLF